MYLVIPILDNKEKSKIANDILRQLPEWFGIEEGIISYVNNVANNIFLAAYEGDKHIGFISIKINNKYTAEIDSMGILKEHHQKGVGNKLIIEGEKILREKHYKFLMVKTLGESHPDIHYKNTREFYLKVGFYPLEEIKEIWGEDNPCLVLVKKLDLGDRVCELEKEDIKETLKCFMDGFDNLDGSIIKKAFHTSARVLCNLEGKVTDRSIEEFCKLVECAKNYPEHPYNKEKCKKRISYIDIFDNGASAKVEWVFTKFIYHDYYNMLKIDGRWYIMNKVFSKEILEK